MNSTALPPRDFLLASVLCQWDGCANQGQPVNTWEIAADDLEALYEGYGHGAEDAADFCPACGRLGLLLDPRMAGEDEIATPHN